MNINSLKTLRQANLLHKANILREYVKTVEGNAMIKEN